MMTLALDLGKFNTMCCFFDSETLKHEFIVVETQREYLTKIFNRKHVATATSQTLDFIVDCPQSLLGLAETRAKFAA